MMRGPTETTAAPRAEDLVVAVPREAASQPLVVASIRGEPALLAFVEEVAHGVRTPLTTLMLHAHLIQEPVRRVGSRDVPLAQEDVARILESAEAIQESVERLAGTLRRVAEGARLADAAAAPTPRSLHPPARPGEDARLP